ncbi:MAG: helix-hairpin-helix domain-containing protein [Deltaproteobacteria bacterium]|nr:helix-hairpin-helix domain-containing protein [Deltaproteobacteria bacterium]
MALVGLAQGWRGRARAPAKVAIREPVRESPGAIALREGRPIDVNHASQADLELLPRVGPAIAGRIVAARPFTSIEDLQRVRGIGPRTVERLRSMIVVHQEGDESAATLAPAPADGYQGLSPGARSRREGAYR